MLKNVDSVKIVRSDTADNFGVFSDTEHLHSINLASEKYTQSRTSLDPFYIEANFDSDNVGFPSCGSDNGLTINQFMSGAFNRRISD